MTFTAKTRRRWFGALCLLASIVMLAAGETTPGKRLDGVVFVIYWLACFVFAALAMLAAIFDARALRREAREEQRALMESTLEEIRANKGASSNLKRQNKPQTSNSDSPHPS